MEARVVEQKELRAKSTSTSAGNRRDKFVRIAEKRTANAIKAIRVIGKLGNRAHYEYSERDVKKISAALSREIEALKRRMIAPSSHEAIEFKL
jgi:hypothetical protein